MTNIEELLKRADEATAWAKGLSDFSLIRDLAAALRETQNRYGVPSIVMELAEERDQLRAENESLERELVLQSDHSRNLARDKASLGEENARLSDECGAWRGNYHKLVKSQMERAEEAEKLLDECEAFVMQFSNRTWNDRVTLLANLRARKEGKG